MAADFGASISSMALSGVSIFIWGAVIIIALAAAVGGSIFFYKRKKWNLRLEIKLPRSDGQLILSDEAKGYWDAENGWIVVKRKGYRKVATHPIDPKKWLKGKNFATLIQVGPEDFVIASENSYNLLKDEETGNVVALMDIVADVGKRKTWKNYTERTSKKSFTLAGFLEAHWRAIEIAIILFCMFMGFTILWIKLGSVCAAPAAVAAITPLINSNRVMR